MDIQIKTTDRAEIAVENLLRQTWFPNPGRAVRAYTEDGGILILTEHWESYRVTPDGDIYRVTEVRDSLEPIILD